MLWYNNQHLIACRHHHRVAPAIRTARVRLDNGSALKTHGAENSARVGMVPPPKVAGEKKLKGWEPEPAQVLGLHHALNANNIFAINNLYYTVIMTYRKVPSLTRKGMIHHLTQQ